MVYCLALDEGDIALLKSYVSQICIIFLYVYLY